MVIKKESFYEELQEIFDQFPRYHMNIFLGDFNAKVGSEEIFKPIIGNESLHEVSNDNWVRVVNFTTSKNLSRAQHSHTTTFIHNRNPPDGVTHNQIHHVLIDKKQHSNILY
jgi:hypothetical protein